MGGGLESRCVGRVYGADGAVRQCPIVLHVFLKVLWHRKFDFFIIIMYIVFFCICSTHFFRLHMVDI